MIEIRIGDALEQLREMPSESVHCCVTLAYCAGLIDADGTIGIKLMPYLRIKRQQAENCLELRRLKEQSRAARTAHGRGHVGGKKRPEEISVAMSETHLRAKSLNQVGVAS